MKRIESLMLMGAGGVGRQAFDASIEISKEYESVKKPEEGVI